MRSQTYDKAELIAKIQANRDSHRALYTEAMDGYLKEVKQHLRWVTRDVREGRKPDFYVLVRLPVPEDHTKDYDAVLTMLDMAVGAQIEVDERDFRSYVLDEWSWKNDFIGTTSTYTANR